VKSRSDAVVAVVAALLVAIISASGCSQTEQPAQQDASQLPAGLGDFGEADGVAALTVLTPSGAKVVQGEVSYPEVFGTSVALRDLHAVLLGKHTGESFNVQALIDTGESLPFAALQLVAQAADPSSVPIVAKLAAGPDKRMRKWGAGALGVMGEKSASLRKPIEDAVKTTLRPTEGTIPDWLAKAFRQPLLLHQDASGTVHVDGEPHDLDSVRKLLREHVRKTGDDYVTVSRSPRTSDAAGNELNLLIQREVGILTFHSSSLALPESVWNPINLEPSSEESEDTPDTEPLPLSARVLALYRLRKITTAGNELLQVTRISRKGVRARTPSRNKSDLEEKLRHAHVVQLVAYCLAVERKTSAEDRVKATGTEQISSAAFSAARSARETMQNVIDETKRLEAENSPLVTHRVIQAWEYAERQLADLAVQETGELKDLVSIRPPKDYTGTWTLRFDNGQKRYEGVYERGKRDGTCTSWYRSGAMASRGAYQNGILQGSRTDWYESGRKAHEWVRWVADGKEHLKSKTWDKSGDLIFIGHDINGERVWSQEYENGKLVWEGVTR